MFWSFMHYWVAVDLFCSLGTINNSHHIKFKMYGLFYQALRSFKFSVFLGSLLVKESSIFPKTLSPKPVPQNWSLYIFLSNLENFNFVLSSCRLGVALSIFNKFFEEFSVVFWKLQILLIFKNHEAFNINTQK